MLKWPGSMRCSLRQRIAAIVIVHAVVVFAVFVLFTQGSDAEIDRVYLLPEPDQVAAVARSFAGAPADTYPDLIRAFEGNLQRVELLHGLPPTEHEGDDPHPAGLSFGAYESALAGRPFRFEGNADDLVRTLDRQSWYSRSPLRVIVGLPGGQAISIEHYAAPPVARFITRFWWWGVTGFVINILVIFWLSAQSTVPVERLAKAVRCDDMSLMPAHGAREFVALGNAFRDMRTSLQLSLDERTRIIAAVAHDFRTYLTRLELRSDFITNRRQRELASHDLLEMRQLMDDALIIARPDRVDSDQEASIDVAEALRQIVWIRQDLGETISLSGAAATEPVRACVTPVAFQRMMANLLDNAMRYGGGTAEIVLDDSGQEIAICVEDAGSGVPAARLKDLTEPFFRVEASRARHTAGAGLGLSIVLALVNRFKGTFSIENRMEGGLRARLLLRRADHLVLGAQD